MFKFNALFLALGCLIATPVLATQHSEQPKRKHIASEAFAPKAKSNLLPTARIIDRAHQLIGAPYKWGGSSVKSGFDCSGLLVYLFRSEAGVNLPRTTAAMIKSPSKTIARHQLKSGDAVFFKHNGDRAIGHVGLYIGNNQFIHAPRTGKTIRIDSLNNSYWKKSYVTAKRLHEPAKVQRARQSVSSR